jgi:hypothetical protein
MNEDQFQPVVFKHPIVRDYPAGWEDKLVLFLKQEIRWQELPDIVGHVDRFHNRDYRPPSWREVYLGTNGFSGF